VTEARPFNVVAEACEADGLFPKRSKITFNDIVGMEPLKERIRRYLLKARNPDEVGRWKMAKKGGGLLLFGPPGTGKTFFAQAVAGELDAAFFDVKFSNLLSKWGGESQKNVAKLFDELRKQERAVLYMDEIDGVLSARGSTGSSVREGVISEFLQAMDGVRCDMKSLLFIGAINLPATLDRAIVSRISGLIYVPLPDAEMRKAYLERMFRHLPDGAADDIDLDALAGRFERCSMRDMRRFGEALADIGIAGKLGGKSGRIEAADVDRAWRDAGCNPMSQTELAKYEKFAQERAGD
jgi:transitional endoplasmic reticulum ATPase